MTKVYQPNCILYYKRTDIKEQDTLSDMTIVKYQRESQKHQNQMSFSLIIVLLYQFILKIIILYFNNYLDLKLFYNQIFMTLVESCFIIVFKIYFHLK